MNLLPTPLSILCKRRIRRLAAALSVVLVLLPTSVHAAEPAQHDRSVATRPFSLSLQCGDLDLVVDSGTETERVDTVQHGDVVTVRIKRSYAGVTLAGSDGVEYRAVASVHARFVLVAPDLDNPVRGREVVELTVIGPHGSPGRLREVLTIAHGQEQDLVTGGCDYGAA